MAKTLLSARSGMVGPAAAFDDATVQRLLLALVAIVMAVRVWLIFRININWDEFFYLSHVYAYGRGELVIRLQTFHVHLFGWLARVGGTEVDQIFAARAVMLACSAAACGFIFLIARLHFSRTVALLCVLCYLSFSEVMRHGASFRADPLYAALMLAATYTAMMRGRVLVWPALGGGAAALALAITIKAALFFPMIGALCLIRLIRGGFVRAELWRVAAFAGAFVACLGALSALHIWLVPSIAAAADAGTLESGYTKTIADTTFFPRWPTAVMSFINDPIGWIAILVGAAIVLYSLVARRRETVRRDLELLCLVSPLAFPLFYRNAFPYFYVLLLAFAVIAAGAAFALIETRLRAKRERGLVMSLCGAAFSVIFLASYVPPHLVDETRGEREVLALVHRLFPEPVAYIDRCSMVSSFRKVGFFMSTWGIEAYRDAGRPVMRALIEANQPRFLIANTELLDISKPYDETGFSARYRLFREDYEALKENFVRHWGPLYVAGKTLDFGTAATTRSVEILIAGRYTVEGAAAVVDGNVFQPGQIVTLARGTHRMGAVSAPSTVVLRWGDHLFRPEGEPPSQLFTGL